MIQGKPIKAFSRSTRSFRLLADPCIGFAFVPYFRQILPGLKIFYSRNVHKLDSIDYSRAGRLGDIVEQTLMLLERCGGPNAYINIKYAIPTYESCVNNWG